MSIVSILKTTVCVLSRKLPRIILGQARRNMAQLSPRDPSSFARPEHAVVTDMFMNLTVDFDKKVLTGYVDLLVKVIDKSVKELILDVKDLNITEISNVNTNTKLSFDISDTVKGFGSKLTVQTPFRDDQYKIRITYTTHPEASGLQWLEPVHTAGKQHPYLFSQCEPIHARSVFPCQDTPAVKTRYTASITSKEVFTVLMSAHRKGVEVSGDKKVSQFEQSVPIPSYLVALAVGDLEFRKIGPRSHVWAEREIIEACAYEFSDTEHQLATAESICGPYVWGIYDLLVLPPSFPFGGMENPCLTFVTPTLLAGDKSLANVVAHEIAHSWTGNLVTNRNFEHFWLNEGFTVFLERKIKGRLGSTLDQDFDAHNGLQELKEEIQTLGENSPLTHLVQNLTGVHPDDAFSRVPYEKGQTFLRYLENLLGGPESFEPFLKKYFDHFKYKSIDTDDFRKFLEDHFKGNTNLATIDWDKWLHTPGLPPVIPEYDISLAKKADELRNRLVQPSEIKSNLAVLRNGIDNLTPEQKIYLMQSIFTTGPHPLETVKSLQSFGFDDVQNAEIKFFWFRICIGARWEEKLPLIFNWINSVGRMKYVRPIYRDLYGWEAARPKAIENFEANRKTMMSVLERGLLKDLHLNA